MVEKALFENIGNEASAVLFRIFDEVGAIRVVLAPKLTNSAFGSQIREQKLRLVGYLRINPGKVVVTPESNSYQEEFRTLVHEFSPGNHN